MEPQSKFVDTGDLQFHYLEWSGNGPPVLLLHGRGLCAQVWRLTANALASHFRVIAMDLRGHGASDKPGKYGWDEVAPDLKRFIESLDLNDVLLVGHSRGAVVATLGGALVRDRIRGAILIEPGIPVPNPEKGSHDDRSAAARIARGRRSTWPDRQTIFDRYSKAPVFKYWKTEILWEYINFGTEELPDGQIELKCTPEIEGEFTAAQAPDNLNELLELIDFPIHLITSENKARHPESSAPLQQLRTIAPSFNHVIFEGTGHFIPQEQPERLEKEIWQFVDSGVMNPL